MIGFLQESRTIFKEQLLRPRADREAAIVAVIRRYQNTGSTEDCAKVLGLCAMNGFNDAIDELLNSPAAADLNVETLAKALKLAATRAHTDVVSRLLQDERLAERFGEASADLRIKILASTVTPWTHSKLDRSLHPSQEQHFQQFKSLTQLPVLRDSAPSLSEFDAHYLFPHARRMVAKLFASEIESGFPLQVQRIIGSYLPDDMHSPAPRGSQQNRAREREQLVTFFQHFVNERPSMRSAKALLIEDAPVAARGSQRPASFAGQMTGLTFSPFLSFSSSSSSSSSSSNSRVDAFSELPTRFPSFGSRSLTSSESNASFPSLPPFPNFPSFPSISSESETQASPESDARSPSPRPFKRSHK